MRAAPKAESPSACPGRCGVVDKFYTCVQSRPRAVNTGAHTTTGVRAAQRCRAGRQQVCHTYCCPCPFQCKVVVSGAQQVCWVRKTAGALGGAALQYFREHSIDEPAQRKAAGVFGGAMSCRHTSCAEPGPNQGVVSPCHSPVRGWPRRCPAPDGAQAQIAAVQKRSPMRPATQRSQGSSSRGQCAAGGRTPAWF